MATSRVSTVHRPIQHPATSQLQSSDRLAVPKYHTTDPLLGNLSPEATLQALSSTNAVPKNERAAHDILTKSISKVSPAERALGIRAAIVAQKLSGWCKEVQSWEWPKRTDVHLGKGFIPPIAKVEIEYWGSLPSSVVEAREARIEEIRDGMESLNVEELKEHVLNAHIPMRSRPSSSNSTMSVPPPLSYVQLSDFTAVITATILRALPHLSRLNSLLSTWSVRLLVLRQIPGLLHGLQFARCELDSALNLLKSPKPPSEIDPLYSIANYHAKRTSLESMVVSTGRRMDRILDALEGREDSLPESWIDDLEAMESDFGAWVVEAERLTIQNEWCRLSTMPKKSEPVLRVPEPETPSETDEIAKNPSSAVSESIESESIDSPPPSQLQTPEPIQAFTGPEPTALKETKDLPGTLSSASLLESEEPADVLSSATQPGTHEPVLTLPEPQQPEISSEFAVNPTSLASKASQSIKLSANPQPGSLPEAGVVQALPEFEETINSNNSIVTAALTPVEPRLVNLSSTPQSEFQELELPVTPAIVQTARNKPMETITEEIISPYKFTSSGSTRDIESSPIIQSIDTSHSESPSTASSNEGRTPGDLLDLNQDISIDPVCFAPAADLSDIENTKIKAEAVAGLSPVDEVLAEHSPLADEEYIEQPTQAEQANEVLSTISEDDGISLSSSDSLSDEMCLDQSKPAEELDLDSVKSLVTKLPEPSKAHEDNTSHILPATPPVQSFPKTPIDAEGFPQTKVARTPESSAYLQQRLQPPLEITRKAPEELEPISEVEDQEQSMAVKDQPTTPTSVSIEVAPTGLPAPAMPTQQLSTHPTSPLLDSPDLFLPKTACSGHEDEAPEQTSESCTPKQLLKSPIKLSKTRPGRLDLDKHNSKPRTRRTSNASAGSISDYPSLVSSPEIHEPRTSSSNGTPLLLETPPHFPTDYQTSNSVTPNNDHTLREDRLFHLDAQKASPREVFAHNRTLSLPLQRFINERFELAYDNESSVEGGLATGSSGSKVSASLPSNSREKNPVARRQKARSFTPTNSLRRLADQHLPRTQEESSGAESDSSNLVQPQTQDQSKEPISKALGRDSPPVEPPTNLTAARLRKQLTAHPSLESIGAYRSKARFVGDTSADQHVEKTRSRSSTPNPQLIEPKDHMDEKINSILTTLPTRIHLVPADQDGDGVSVASSLPFKTRERFGSSSPLGFPSRSSTPTPSLTLRPAVSRRRHSHAHAPEESSVKLYHLHRGGKSAPTKLFVRSVGENGERVMVRVGGGWADLGEYLREYAIHHGRRHVSETPRVEVEGLSARESPSYSPPNKFASSGNGRHIPSRPQSVISNRPSSSLAVRKIRRASNVSDMGDFRSVSAGEVLHAPFSPMSSSLQNRRLSVSSNVSAGAISSVSEARHGSPSGPAVPLGLAGPKPRAKHVSISPESEAWVEDVLGQARRSSSLRPFKFGLDHEPSEASISVLPKAKSISDIGKAGSSKRVALRGLGSR